MDITRAGTATVECYVGEDKSLVQVSSCPTGFIYEAKAWKAEGHRAPSVVKKDLEQCRHGRRFQFGGQGHCAQITDLCSKAGRSPASIPNWPWELDQSVHLSEFQGYHLQNVDSDFTSLLMDEVSSF